MLGLLKGKWKLWAIGALAVTLAAAAWQWRSEIETRVRYAVQGEQLEQALRDAEQRAEDAEEERRRLERLAAQRQSQLDDIRERERETRRELEAIRAEDDIWGRPIPDAAVDWLRGNGGAKDSDGDGD